MTKLYFDGASKGNPGKAGCGWYIEGGKKGCKYLGIATNNQAEYQGLIGGLEEISNYSEKLEIYGDSKLVIEQMKGNWKVKSDNIKPLYEKAISIVKKFDNITFTWIKRDKNKEADYMANQAIC